MANRVPYHHPDDHQYSLAYVAPSREDLDVDPDAIVERFAFDESFVVLYTNEGASGATNEIDADFEATLDEMDAADRVIVLRLLQIFEGIVDAAEDEEGFEVYKHAEVDRIPPALDRVDWNQNAVDVAAQILSTLVLAHTLPNANHRSSIGLAEWYLECAHEAFSLPAIASEDDWAAWVDEYIEESKRVLTVRRNTTAFSLLDTWGCDVVERKGGIEIDLAEYDLDFPRSEALAEYAERHTELCSEFLTESVRRAGHEELCEKQGPTKAAFARYLEKAV